MMIVVMCGSTATISAVIVLLFVKHITESFASYIVRASIMPLTYTAYLRQPAVRFYCSATGASNIVWIINGLLSNGANTPGVVIKTDISILKSNLTIASTIENNNTRIQCAAQHIGSIQLTASDNATFHVQGQLSNILQCP